MNESSVRGMRFSTNRANCLDGFLSFLIGWEREARVGLIKDKVIVLSWFGRISKRRQKRDPLSRER
jgi:hypothetical protein